VPAVIPSVFDQEIAARTIYMEARNQRFAGMLAVGKVIKTRALMTGLTIAQVCLWPKQFSCWNVGPVPDRNWLMGTDDSDIENKNIADEAAATAWRDDVTDNTYGATHYLTHQAIQDGPPKWYSADAMTVVIGDHVFLKLAHVVGEHHASILEMAAQATEGTVT
jgi:hypothetical protein